MCDLLYQCYKEPKYEPPAPTCVCPPEDLIIICPNNVKAECYNKNSMRDTKYDQTVAITDVNNQSCYRNNIRCIDRNINDPTIDNRGPIICYREEDNATYKKEPKVLCRQHDIEKWSGDCKKCPTNRDQLCQDVKEKKTTKEECYNKNSLRDTQCDQTIAITDVNNQSCYRNNIRCIDRNISDQTFDNRGPIICYREEEDYAPYKKEPKVLCRQHDLERLSGDCKKCPTNRNQVCQDVIEKRTTKEEGCWQVNTRRNGMDLNDHPSNSYGIGQIICEAVAASNKVIECECQQDLEDEVIPRMTFKTFRGKTYGGLGEYGARGGYGLDDRKSANESEDSSSKDKSPKRQSMAVRKFQKAKSVANDLKNAKKIFKVPKFASENAIIVEEDNPFNPLKPLETIDKIYTVPQEKSVASERPQVTKQKYYPWFDFSVQVTAKKLPGTKRQGAIPGPPCRCSSTTVSSSNTSIHLEDAFYTKQQIPPTSVMIYQRKN